MKSSQPIITMALAGIAAYALFRNNDNYQVSEVMSNISSNMAAIISQKEQSGTITKAQADALRNQLSSIDSTAKGVDFINEASRTKVFIQPKQQKTLLSQPRQAGETLQQTWARQREEIAAGVARSVGNIPRTAGAAEANTERLRSLNKDIAPNINNYGSFNAAVQKAANWRSQNPKGKNTNWDRAARNFEQSIIREITHIRSSIQQAARNNYKEGKITFQERTAHEKEANAQFALAAKEIEKFTR